MQQARVSHAWAMDLGEQLGVPVAVPLWRALGPCRAPYGCAPWLFGANRSVDVRGPHAQDAHHPPRTQRMAPGCPTPPQPSPGNVSCGRPLQTLQLRALAGLWGGISSGGCFWGNDGGGQHRCHPPTGAAPGPNRRISAAHDSPTLVQKQGVGAAGWRGRLEGRCWRGMLAGGSRVP